MVFICLDRIYCSPTYQFTREACLNLSDIEIDLFFVVFGFSQFPIGNTV